MPKWITYIIILVVFAVTVYWLQVVSQRTALETFEGTDTGAGATTTTADGTATNTDNTLLSPYVESLDKLPGATTIKYYLTSFSAGTKYDSSFAPFRASETKWYDLFNRNVSFTLIGVLPSMSVLNTGLPLKGIRLVGSPSEQLAGAASYELPSFTYMLYGKMNSIAFENNQPITVFQLYAENPNHVSLVFAPEDSVMVKVELILGNVNRVYQWKVPRSTLLSNGNKTLYSLVYEKLESGTKAYFYVGDLQFSATISNTSAIKLGNSPMDINSDSTLDMTLWNMSLLTSALSRDEVHKWSEYFYVQSTGLAGNLDAALSAFEAATQDAMNELSTQEQAMQDLRSELDKCKASLPSPQSMLENAKAKWHINMDGVLTNPAVTGEESASCMLLNLKKRIAGGEGTNAGSTTGATGAASTGAATGNSATGTTTGTTTTGGSTSAATSNSTTGITGTTDTTSTSTTDTSALQNLLSKFHIRVPGTEMAVATATAEKLTNPTKA